MWTNLSRKLIYSLISNDQSINRCSELSHHEITKRGGENFGTKTTAKI